MESARPILRGAAVIAIAVWVLAVVPLASWGSGLQGAYLQHPKFYSADIKDQERVYQFDAEIVATYCCKEGSLRYANTYHLSVTGTWHEAQKVAIEKLDTDELAFACPHDPWLVPGTKCQYKPSQMVTVISDEALAAVVKPSLADGPISKKWFPNTLPKYLQPTPEILKPTEEYINISQLHAGLGVVIRLPSWFAEFSTAHKGSVNLIATGPVAGSSSQSISVPMQEAVGCLDKKCVVVHVPDAFFEKYGPGGYILAIHIYDAKSTFLKFKVTPPTPVLAAKPLDQSRQAAAAPRIPVPTPGLTPNPQSAQAAAVPHIPVSTPGPTARPNESAQAAAAPRIPVSTPGLTARPNESAQATAAPHIPVSTPGLTARPNQSAQTAAAPRIPVQPRVFASPTWQGVRIDWCLHWTQMCGGPAAIEFCKKNGYAKATAWAPAPHVGPTLVLGDNKSCTAKSCDGFASVTCTN